MSLELPVAKPVAAPPAVGLFDERWEPVLTMSESARESIRRALDVVIASCLLVMLSPLMAAIAVAVRLDGAGPVLFIQRRIGRGGRPFRMLKFRTMHHGAERLREHMGGGRPPSPVFKLANDPRITTVGRFLRQWSLDELPQLVNVVRGDMSLVGPRPLPVADLERFAAHSRELPADVLRRCRQWHRIRHSVRPGITGLWQVTSRDRSDLDSWIQADEAYVARRSLWFDLGILLRTPAAVLRSDGAR